MAFGLDINTQKADAGKLRGSRQKVACECWFTSTGRMMPLMLKIQDEEGEIRTVREIRVHSQEKKNYAGIPTVEYDCTLTLSGRSLRAWLIYYPEESRWILNFR